MIQGKLLGIFITSTRATPLREVQTVQAIPGVGLAGDRYGDRAGTFSKPNEDRADQEVTFIEAEAIEAACRDYGVEIFPIQARRNLLTGNVPLNHLVGREFRVGDVRFRGLRLCEPCGHLEKLTVEGIRKALIHRGGLRAQVLTAGTLRVGDAVIDIE
jgi:MOSC domain-containing protein YiiM